MAWLKQFWIRLLYWGMLVFWMEKSFAVSVSVSENEYRQDERSEADYVSFFGSVHTLEKLSYWAGKEENIYHFLKQRRIHLQRLRKEVKTYLTDYEESSMKAFAHTRDKAAFLKRGELIGSSAILSHLMISRYSNNVQTLRTFLGSDSYKEVEGNIKHIFNVKDGAFRFEQWPKSEDLFLSHFAILKIQEIHGILPELLHIGNTFDTNFGGKLNAKHCTSLGIFALRGAFYYMAIEWLEFATKLLEIEYANLVPSINKELVSNLLDEAVNEHNRITQQGEISNKEREFQDELNTYQNKTYPGENHTKRLPGRKLYYHNVGGQLDYAEVDGYPNFLGICNGQTFQPQSIQKRMKCYLEKTHHPYLILNPVKTEMLSENPYIVQMYDVVGNNLIQELYEARQEMKLLIKTGDDDVMHSLKHRNAGGCVIRDRELEVRIDKKSEIITGLQIASTDEELIQLVEYAYGRFCTIHRDTKSYGTREEIDLRVATILYYLDDSLFGGRTAFPSVGISAEPIRGSAVIWYNVYKNGTIRQDVTHASCPILHGSKSVLNRWVKYETNFHNFKCTLNEFE